MLPQIFIGAADVNPVEMQDLLPADTRFKILVFAGDLAVSEDKARLQKLAENLSSPNSFLNRYGRKEGGDWKVFDILTISCGTKDKIGYVGRSSNVAVPLHWLVLTRRLQISPNSSALTGGSKHIHFVSPFSLEY